MVALSQTKVQRVRLLGGLAFAIATSIALVVRIGLNDGGWPLFIATLGAAGVVVWPSRPMVIVAIVVTAAMLVLGLMTVGILYGLALTPLIFALAAPRLRSLQSTDQT